MGSKHSLKDPVHSSLALGLCLAVCAAEFIRILFNSWIAIDSFITYRVIENFAQGYGLRWNTDERVQVYTHPLWMLLHIPFYFLYNKIAVISVGLSLSCASLAVWILARSGKSPSPMYVTFGLLVPLMLSTVFTDYSNCGLENPLSCLCIAIFLYAFFKPVTPAPHLLLLATSLAMITRLDNIIILFPALIWGCWQERRELRFGKILLACSPLITWEMFSIFYYGFFLPNTKYAKTPPDIPMLEYLNFGMRYLKTFIYYDAAGAVFLLCAILIGIYCLIMAVRLVRQKNAVSSYYVGFVTLVAGIALNAAYVARVGGDYMEGRFVFNMVFMAIGTMFFFFQRHERWLFAALTASVTMFAVQNLSAMQWAGLYHLSPIYQEHVRDIRRMFPNNSLYSSDKLWEAPKDFGGAKLTGENKRVAVRKTVASYSMAPWSIVIDQDGLCDALIARLPVRDLLFKPGHLQRAIPDGYKEARKTGDTSKMDPDLAKYYEKLRLLTSGDLWDAERLEAIIGFQLGWYDAWLDSYVSRIKTDSIANGT